MRNWLLYLDLQELLESDRRLRGNQACKLKVGKEKFIAKPPQPAAGNTYS
jgi:hypothetical protein